MGQLTAFNLNEFINEFDVKTYFETGTGVGISLDYANKFNFDKIYSIDIDSELIENSKKKFGSINKINLINDLSKNALNKILPTLNNEEPILFFLDAHFPGADFHKISYEESIRTYKEDAFPLEQELNIIKSIRNNSKDVIIIDDFILYEKSGNYETIKEGVIWKYDWLQEELNLKTESVFIYNLFKETHDFKKDERHQGYLIITPKKK